MPKLRNFFSRFLIRDSSPVEDQDGRRPAARHPALPSVEQYTTSPPLPHTPIHALAPELLGVILDDLPLRSILSFALTSHYAYSVSVIPLNRHVIITQSNIFTFRRRMEEADPRNAFVKDVEVGRTDRVTKDSDPWDVGVILKVLWSFPNLRSLKTFGFVYFERLEGVHCFGGPLASRLQTLQARIEFRELNRTPRAAAPVGQFHCR